VTLTNQGVSGAGWVEVETTTNHLRVKESTIVAELIGSDLPARLRFPAISTVVKRKTRVSVDGRCHSLSVYECGSSSVITCRVGERWIWLRAVHLDPTDLTIVSLGPSEVEEALGTTTLDMDGA
jgi:hypothetical protein